MTKKDDDVQEKKEQKVEIKSNNQFCSILHTQFFNEEQCNAIKDKLVEELWLAGETIGGGVNKKVRFVEQQTCPINQQGWPITKVLELAQQANGARFKFNLAGFLDNDTPMIMRYKKGGHYDWHTDLGNKVCHRKLSFTIQLSDSDDYEGGDIEFIGSKVDKLALRQKGTCIIYPSFIPHKITKVTKGERLAIVGWIHGPTFV
jgi:predicted 2-oxoglutarate/Fe(II)-dependent dioxygenase YbiX